MIKVEFYLYEKPYDKEPLIVADLLFKGYVSYSRLHRIASEMAEEEKAKSYSLSIPKKIRKLKVKNS